MRPPRHEFVGEAVAAGVGDVVFVRYGRDGALGVLAGEGFVEEDEVGEAAADGGVGGLEGAEVGL